MIFLSITIVILILINFLTFLWRNTSNLFNVASIIAQLSHPHRSKLQGIAQKIKFLNIFDCVVGTKVVESSHCGGSLRDSVLNIVIIL